MRTAHWILVLNVLLFVTSIWFVLAGARGEGAAAAAPESVSTVKQLMDGIIGPASGTVYRSVSIMVSAEGEQENYPRTDREWEIVAASAAAIAEAGHLLMSEKHVRDTEAWAKMSQAMIDASLISMKAAQDKDKEAVLASGEALNESCDGCHRRYMVDE